MVLWTQFADVAMVIQVESPSVVNTMPPTALPNNFRAC